MCKFSAQDGLIVPSGTVLNEFLLEISMLTRVRHKKVVSYVGASIVPPHVSIVTEWIQLGSLRDVTLQYELNPGMKAKLCMDAIEALAYCHENGIIHRDMKPTNVLVESVSPQSNVNAKLADFGSSREETADDLEVAPDLEMMRLNEDAAVDANYTRGVGTPIYMAPEVLQVSCFFSFKNFKQEEKFY